MFCNLIQSSKTEPMCIGRSQCFILPRHPTMEDGKDSQHTFAGLLRCSTEIGRCIVAVHFLFRASGNAVSCCIGHCIAIAAVCCSLGGLKPQETKQCNLCCLLGRQSNCVKENLQCLEFLRLVWSSNSLESDVLLSTHTWCHNHPPCASLKWSSTRDIACLFLPCRRQKKIVHRDGHFVCGLNDVSMFPICASLAAWLLCQGNHDGSYPMPDHCLSMLPWCGYSFPIQVWKVCTRWIVSDCHNEVVGTFFLAFTSANLFHLCAVGGSLGIHCLLIPDGFSRNLGVKLFIAEQTIFVTCLPQHKWQFSLKCKMDSRIEGEQHGCPHPFCSSGMVTAVDPLGWFLSVLKVLNDQKAGG